MTEERSRMIHNLTVTGLLSAVDTFADGMYKARQEGGKITLLSPVAEVTMKERRILGYTETLLILQIELSGGTIRLDRYGNIDIMYRR